MLTTIWSGLTVGALYILVGLTYNITFAATGIFNFAQSQIVMASAFAVYLATGEHHWPTLVTLVVCAAIGAAIGLIEELVAIRPLNDSRGLGYLVTTVGAAVVIQGFAYAFFGPNAFNVGFFAGNQPLTVAGGQTTPVSIAIVILAVAGTIALWLVSVRTRWGLASRGVTMDQQLAAIRGINVRRVVLFAFVIAGLLGGVIGLFVAPYVGVSYDLGNNLVIFAFLVMAVGGFGSYWGVLIAGFPVGVLQAECERWLPAGASTIVLFFALLAVLMVRPMGLLGRGMRSV